MPKAEGSVHTISTQRAKPLRMKDGAGRAGDNYIPFACVTGGDAVEAKQYNTLEVYKQGNNASSRKGETHRLVAALANGPNHGAGKLILKPVWGAHTRG